LGFCTWSPLTATSMRTTVITEASNRVGFQAEDAVRLGASRVVVEPGVRHGDALVHHDDEAALVQAQQPGQAGEPTPATSRHLAVYSRRTSQKAAPARGSG
jgi:hypothetical protein